MGLTACWCMQVLVIFYGSKTMMWHRPSEVLPFAAHKEEKLREGRNLHEAKRLPRSLEFLALQAAAEVRWESESTAAARCCPARSDSGSRQLGRTSCKKRNLHEAKRLPRSLELPALQAAAEVGLVLCGIHVLSCRV